MKKVFPSKVDTAIPILFVVTSIPAIAVGIKEKEWEVFAIMLISVVFVLYLLYDTNYTITPGNLKVHSGFIVNKNIPIEQINSIKKTNSVLSAPASSFSDRIEVFYGESKSIIISPKEKQAFVEELLKQHSEIAVEV
jgi:uncharacterized membrane protein YdbT with pleckstrin-like domain